MVLVSKRILSVLLAAALAFSLCPGMAYAEEDEGSSAAVAETEADASVSQDSSDASAYFGGGEVSGANTDSQTRQKSQQDSASVEGTASDADVFEFIYVDAKVLALGETQKIVVALRTQVWPKGHCSTISATMTVSC